VEHEGLATEDELQPLLPSLGKRVGEGGRAIVEPVVLEVAARGSLLGGEEAAARFWYRSTVEFRVFNATLHAGKVKAYIQFVLALSAMAIRARAASSKKRAFNRSGRSPASWTQSTEVDERG